MTQPAQTVIFEDTRWRTRDQHPMWRHRVALKLVGAEPVLDVGGGDGLFLSMLREQRGFQQLSLLDVSPVTVSKANAKGFDARVWDISQRLPFSDHTFGTVCALDVLEHLYDPVSALREMLRVGRHVIIVVPNFQYWRDRIRVLFGQVPFSCRPRRGHVYWFNYATLKDIVRVEYLLPEQFVVGAFTRFGPVGAWLARARPSLFAHSFALKLSTDVPQAVTGDEQTVASRPIGSASSLDFRPEPMIRGGLAGSVTR